MTTMYYADLQLSRVDRVEVRRATDAPYSIYFATYEEAAQCLRTHLKAKIVEARYELAYREHKLAAFDALHAVQP
jgi:hypothetical protein